MKTLPLEVGERIRTRRIAVGLTQGRLARQAGVSRRHLAALEKGANVSTLVLAKVGSVLDYSLSELFREELLGAADVSTQRYGSVFISYGTPDEDVARRIFQDLVGTGVSCFFFPVTAVPGKKLHRTIADGVRRFDRTVLIASAQSLSRPGVSNEIEQVLALEAEEGGTTRIIPVALDDCLFVPDGSVPVSVLMQLRQRVIADFRNAVKDDHIWQSRINDLLRALRRS